MNIILQHWTGELSELTKLSSANITRYAESVGAEYSLIRGQVFRENLTPACQKLHMLDEKFDNYDMVVMLDPDMFVRKGMTENVFTDIDGVGMFAEVQGVVFNGLKRRHPHLMDANYPYWGGAIYRLDHDLRRKLRAQIRDEEMVQFGTEAGKGEDEGIMHRLAVLAKIEKSKTPGGYKWCHCSYREGIENAAFIHIRTKITPTGPKRTKMENYNDLVKRGLI